MENATARKRKNPNTTKNQHDRYISRRNLESRLSSRFSTSSWPLPVWSSILSANAAHWGNARHTFALLRAPRPSFSSPVDSSPSSTSEVCIGASDISTSVPSVCPKSKSSPSLESACFLFLRERLWEEMMSNQDELDANYQPTLDDRSLSWLYAWL